MSVTEEDALRYLQAALPQRVKRKGGDAQINVAISYDDHGDVLSHIRTYLSGHSLQEITQQQLIQGPGIVGAGQFYMPAPMTFPGIDVQSQIGLNENDISAIEKDLTNRLGSISAAQRISGSSPTKPGKKPKPPKDAGHSGP